MQVRLSVPKDSTVQILRENFIANISSKEINVTTDLIFSSLSLSIPIAYTLAAWNEKYRRDPDEIDERYLQKLKSDPDFQVRSGTMKLVVSSSHEQHVAETFPLAFPWLLFGLSGFWDSTLTCILIDSKSTITFDNPCSWNRCCTCRSSNGQVSLGWESEINIYPSC